MLFLTLILIHYYRKHKDERLSWIYLFLISGGITATFTLIDFDVEKLFSIEGTEFSYNKKIDIHEYNSDEKHLYKFKKKKSLYVFFDNNSIVVKSKIKGSNKKQQITSLKELNEIFKNKSSIYTVKLIGSASDEVIKNTNNSLSDNYQISLARANNVKEYIMQQINDDDFIRKNITFNIFAFSNQKPKSSDNNKKYEMNRNVMVEISEFEKIIKKDDSVK